MRERKKEIKGRVVDLWRMMNYKTKEFRTKTKRIYMKWTRKIKSQNNKNIML